MAKTDETTVQQVEAASEATAPVVEESRKKPSSVTTTVWCPGKQAAKEALYAQAKVNTRDAIPVMSYDVDCKVVGTKAKTVDKTEGTAWEISVTYTPRTDVPPEPVDLEKVIAEAKSGYDSTHPGDPDFLGSKD